MLVKYVLGFFTAALFAVACAPKKITWVAIGDSITYLNEHPEAAANRITKGYMTRVHEQMPFISYTNQGHDGWKSSDIADSINNLGLVKADVYSVFLGTNDWWAGVRLGSMDDYKNNNGAGTVYGSFRIIIDKLRSLNPAAKIILVTPLQRGDFVSVNDAENKAEGSYKEVKGQLLSQFADCISRIGKHENFDVVDLYNNSGITQENMVKFKRLKNPETGAYRNYTYPEFVNIPFNPSTDEHPYPVDAIDMTYDGLHPSDKGYAVIADMLIKVLKK